METNTNNMKKLDTYIFVHDQEIILDFNPNKEKEREVLVSKTAKFICEYPKKRYYKNLNIFGGFFYFSIFKFFEALQLILSTKHAASKR